MRRILIALSMLVLTGTLARAVDVYDGVRAPPGLYYLNYLSFYYADTVTDSSGDTAIADFRYRSVFETLRLSWYTSNLMFTALAPIGHVESGFLSDSDDGLGDMTLAGGGFLPTRKLDILALLAADVPTGEFEEDARINVGRGQWNIRPSLFVHKEKKPYTFDGVVKYNFRQENPDTNFKFGDEFQLALCPTRQFGGVKIGPSVKWLVGKDGEQDGHTVPDSAKQVFSVGGEAWFRALGCSLVLNYMADAYVENSTRGHLFRFKVVKKL